MILFCPNCGGEVDAEDAFCCYCGVALRQCPHCGVMVDKDDLFCYVCGGKLEDDDYGTDNPGIIKHRPLNLGSDSSMYYSFDVRKLDIEENVTDHFRTWTSRTGTTQIGALYDEISLGQIIVWKGARYKVTSVELRDKETDKVITADRQPINNGRHREGEYNPKSKVIKPVDRQDFQKKQDKIYEPPME